jgi:predicted kinase
MKEGKTPLCVSNTTTTNKELEPYLEYAKEYGYTTFVMVVENRHNGINEHNVPEEVLEKMKARLMGSIKL